MTVTTGEQEPEKPIAKCKCGGNLTISGDFFKCFACGEGGDKFKLVMMLEGISFFEAVERLGSEEP